jgi:hypothetical protein
MRPNKSSVALLILLVANKLLVGYRKAVNCFLSFYNRQRIFASFLRNSLAALRSKSMFLQVNNSNNTLYIARVRAHVKDKVIE